MPARSRLLLVLIVAVAAAVGVVVSLWRPPAPPDLAWAPYQDDYHTKIALAPLEHELPLSPATLARVTPASLKALDQEQLNQLYARLTAGPIPDGPLGGDLFFPRGASGDVRLSEIVGGVKGLFLGVGSIKKLTFEGATTWLLFPAKLYCGQSLLDGRRESTIIDYAFTDDIEGYREKPDFLAGRHGLDVRDEIRMIRPGFYLGRAYMHRVFVLNFTLYNAEIAKRDGPAFARSGKVAEDCWAGTQRVADLPD